MKTDDAPKPAEETAYSAKDIAAIESIASPELRSQVELYPDRNIFEWYERRLPPQLAGVHLLDWGAGTGRFAPLCLRRQPKRLTLIEPSPAGYARLCTSFGGLPDVEVLQRGLGAHLARHAPPPAVLHLCTFVVNCVESPSEAFRLLAESILPGERLIVFTNVFIPPMLAARLRWDRVLEGMEFDLHRPGPADARLLRSKTFANQIIGSGDVLIDSVHSIFEYQEILRREDRWRIVAANLMPPCGFRHVIRPDDDFGNMVFAVMNLEVERGPAS